MNYSMPKTLSIGLGGNIPSHAGSPQETLIKARPLIEKTIKEWSFALISRRLSNSSHNSEINFCWSPLYETKPAGGPKNQPFFINAVLIVHGEIFTKLNPSVQAATNLLRKFLNIEKTFGRDRNSSNILWGPRSLDIDILSWGNLQVNTSELILPHPYLTERGFVIIPFAKAIQKLSDPLIQIGPQSGWNE